MRLTATMVGSLKADMRAELRRIERAVPDGVKAAGDGLKGSLRKQVVTAGLGARLSRTWRGQAFANSGHDAASLVWSKAPWIVRAFDEGAVIKGKGGRWLAIPTPAAPKRRVGGKRITPATFPTGRYGPLRMVRRSGRSALLVVDGVRVSAQTGRVGCRAKGGGRTKSGSYKQARAYGSSATLLLKREIAYGQAAAGDYIRIPFNRCTLGSEQGLIDDPVLGQGRDPYAPLQDAIMDEGEIVVPVDPRYIGLWLTGLLGTPTTTDDGADPATYTHEFVSGKDSLPSYTVEVGHSQVPAHFRHAGVVFDSIALEFVRSGAVAAAIQCVAQGEERFAASQGGTPTKLDFKRISQFQGSISRAGAAVANLTGGSLTYANNLEKIETIRSDGLIDGADPTVASLTGTIEVRFADTTLIDLASNGTAVDLEFAYEIDSGLKLTFEAHEVYLPKPTLAVEGPGGVSARFDFQGARNEAEGRMLTVTLVNDLDGTDYS